MGEANGYVSKWETSHVVVFLLSLLANQLQKTHTHALTNARPMEHQAVRRPSRQGPMGNSGSSVPTRWKPPFSVSTRVSRSKSLNRYVSSRSARCSSAGLDFPPVEP